MGAVRTRSAAFLLVAGVAGLALAAWLYLSYDLAEVLAAFQAVGWGIGLVCLWRFVPIGLDAAGWRHVFAPDRRPPFRTCWWIRWISESVNALLPVAQIGGEVVRARLVSRRSIVPNPDVSGGEAGGSIVVDVTLGIVATTAFSAAGAALLIALSTGAALNQALWGIAGLVLLLVVLVVAQRRGWVVALAHWITARTVGGLGARDFGRALSLTWLSPRRLIRAQAWRIAASFATAGEVWLALHFQGVDVTFADAVVLESITFAVRTAAFMVPGGLGLQEGTLLLLGQLMGLPPEVALSIALVKRVRELAVGLPALLLWWWLEGRVIRR
jgi:putative membrane protein